ncbi:MAG: MiaB/RimO family radical SAM methylthiotransferase [Lachnospiraceae bacterium]|nr:MiaB/RimO family radical SAM methylthiotransferase [Lachnospiraceae bacterium]
MKTIAFHNLGCKVNAYETDAMMESLTAAGYQIVPFESEADIYIVNTCSVTNIADRKSRQMLHRAKKLNPDAVVVAVGCYVQTGKERIEKDDAIDLAIGNNRKKEIVTILEKYLNEREQSPEKRFAYDLYIPDLSKPVSYEELTIKSTGKNTRAYIKVQDGCNQFCSYCIIPYARGRVRSRKKDDILAEAQGLSDAGYKEIVLTGIHLCSYGLDFLKEEHEKRADAQGEYDYLQQTYQNGYLLDLIRALCRIDGIERVRLGSLEPRIVTVQFAEALASEQKVCPHFHLSMQSGCDATLTRMNRHYTSAEFREKVEILRRTYRDVAVTTDVIVGFPGETDEEFETTRRYLDALNLYEMHVFKYSKRQGTRAATMPGQLTEAVKSARSDILLSMEERQSRAFRERFLDRTIPVLFEEAYEEGGKRYMIGHTREYVRVAVETDEDLRNCLKDVYLTGFLANDLMIGEAV